MILGHNAVIVDIDDCRALLKALGARVGLPLSAEQRATFQAMGVLDAYGRLRDSVRAFDRYEDRLYGSTDD